MEKTIYLDMDGVVANWEKSALEVMDIEPEKIKDLLASPGRLLDKCDMSEVWGKIGEIGTSFWENLELLPWAQDLYDIGKKYGEVLFLTSPGTINKRPNGVAAACHGKIMWAHKYFPETDVIISKNKYHSAGPNKLLVDDTYKKLEPFIGAGGHAYHFPNQWKILAGEIPIEQVLGELERKIQSIDKCYANV